MRVSTSFRSSRFVFLLLIAASLAGCKDYPYTSPMPGTLVVRMKTVSEGIPFGELNRLPMQLTAVRAVRSDNAKQEVFEDLRAIRRYTDSYDAFSREAFDSTLEIGQTYAPPGSYIGLDITTQPLGNVVLDGYRTIQITFAADAESFLRLRTPIPIHEGKATVVVVSFNIDSSLVRGAETYHYHPKFYISSLQTH
jgi:hypothetical protein